MSRAPAERVPTRSCSTRCRRAAGRATVIQDLMCRYLVAKHIIDFLQRLRSVGSSRWAGSSDGTLRP